MEYYDVIASGYDELHSEEQLKKYNIIKEHLDIDENETLLDVGCGIGLSSGLFRGRIIGIDPAKEMLKKSKKKAPENTDYIQARAEYLPFKDKAFDFVITVTAIHNFQEPEIGLEEIKRVGKGKGAVTIMKKSGNAQKLQTLVEAMFEIENVILEEKDTVFFYGIAENKKLGSQSQNPGGKNKTQA